MGPTVLNIRDGILGIAANIRNYFAHLLVGAGVVTCLIAALFMLGAITVVKISNESDLDVRSLVIHDRTLDGVETPLWELDIPAKSTTYKVATQCCDWLVMKYVTNAQTFDVYCRHPELIEFPRFAITLPREGGASCANCRCVDGGVDE